MRTAIAPSPPILIGTLEERAWQRLRLAILRRIDSPSPANWQAARLAQEAYQRAVQELPR
jgi:hypothetical protein